MTHVFQDQRENRTGLVAGAAWMVLLTLLLAFFPLINGLIGGFVGGYKIGSPGRALLAALLPAAVASLGLWVLFTVFGLPVVGFAAGAVAGFLVLLADVGIFAGAALGGYLSESKRQQILPSRRLTP